MPTTVNAMCVGCSFRLLALNVSSGENGGLISALLSPVYATNLVLMGSSAANSGGVAHLERTQALATRQASVRFRDVILWNVRATTGGALSSSFSDRLELTQTILLRCEAAQEGCIHIVGAHLPHQGPLMTLTDLWVGDVRTSAGGLVYADIASCRWTPGAQCTDQELPVQLIRNVRVVNVTVKGGGPVLSMEHCMPCDISSSGLLDATSLAALRSESGQVASLAAAPAALEYGFRRDDLRNYNTSAASTVQQLLFTPDCKRAAFVLMPTASSNRWQNLRLAVHVWLVDRYGTRLLATNTQPLTIAAASNASLASRPVVVKGDATNILGVSAAFDSVVLEGGQLTSATLHVTGSNSLTLTSLTPPRPLSSYTASPIKCANARTQVGYSDLLQLDGVDVYIKGCPAGEFADRNGTRVRCKSCPGVPAMVSKTAGSSECSACPAGTMTPDRIECIACPALMVPRVSNDRVICQPCDANEYPIRIYEPGSDRCQKCPVNTLAANTIACTNGSMSQNHGTCVTRNGKGLAQASVLVMLPAQREVHLGPQHLQLKQGSLGAKLSGP